MKEENPSIKKKTVYLPTDVDEQLRRSAQKHLRSFNSELVWALQRYLANQEKEQNGETIKKP